MIEKCIEGLTWEETEEVLAVVTNLIHQDGDAIRFKKETSQPDGIPGLEYTVVKAEDGRYFLLGHYNKPERNENHYLGEGSFSKVRVAYELEQKEDELYVLGEKDYIVKKAKTPLLPIGWGNFPERFSKTVSNTREYESKNATARLIEKENGAYTGLLFTKRVHGDNLFNYLFKGHFENILLGERLKYINRLAQQLDVKFHRKNKAHRDLKPMNIMLDLERQKIKIIDVDTVATAGKKELLVLSPYHCPPELFNFSLWLLFGKGTVSRKGDVYALGVILTEILYANGNTASGVENYFEEHPSFQEKLQGQPFPETLVGLLRFIRSPFVPVVNDDLGLIETDFADLTDFLNAMTQLDPQKRPDIQRVRMFFLNFSLKLIADEHPFITDALEALLNTIQEDHISISKALKLELLQETYNFLISAIENDELEVAAGNYLEAIEELLSNAKLDCGLSEKIAGAMLAVLGVVSLMLVAAIVGSFCLLASPALLVAAPAFLVAAAAFIISAGTALLTAEGLVVAGVSAGAVGVASIVMGIGFFSKASGKSRDATEAMENLSEQTEELSVQLLA